MLSGLEDVPMIADENCGRCGDSLKINTKLDNFSGWFGFIKKDGQMYRVPLCIKCDKENSATGQKVTED